MRALWVTAEAPDRDSGGGHIREAFLLEALGRAMETDLLLVGTLTDERTRATLHAVRELPPPPPVRVPRNRSHRRLLNLWHAYVDRVPLEVALDRRIRRLLLAHLGAADGYDLVCVEHMSLAPLLPPSRRAFWSLTLHQLASRRAQQELSRAPSARHRLVHRDEYEKASRFEAWAAAAYDLVIAVSPEDAASLPGDAAVVPNGVDLARFQPTPIPSEPRLVLTASLQYWPNVEGATWFCTEVLPRVRDRVPGVSLEIVGRDPVAQVRRLAELPGVELRANVESVVPHLAAARVAVVPLLIGSGTRLKALEAMAAGRPVVGTHIGLEGLGVSDGVEARVADSPEAMGDALVELLTDDSLAQRLAGRGRGLVEARFSWESIGRDYVQLLLERCSRRADVSAAPGATPGASPELAPQAQGARQQPGHVEQAQEG